MCTNFPIRISQGLCFIEVSPETFLLPPLHKSLYFILLKFLFTWFCVCYVSLSVRYKLFGINVTLVDSGISRSAELNEIRLKSQDTAFVLSLGICIFLFKIFVFGFPTRLNLTNCHMPALEVFNFLKILLLILKMPTGKTWNHWRIYSQPRHFWPLPEGQLAMSGDVFIWHIGVCTWNLVGRGQGCY